MGQDTIDSLISLDRDYTVMVRAIGVAGITGPWSNLETFRWSTVPTVGPQVPWPARSMPPVQNTTFHTNMVVEFLENSTHLFLFGHDRVGIRIGEIPPETVDTKYQDREYEVWLDAIYDPMDFLYTNAFNQVETALPCVLYRYQVTNNLYRTVSGDIAQVSPLMESIAWGVDGNDVAKEVTILLDPFVAITHRIDHSEPWGIYLIDTQPVVRGATYQYLLMRFDEETKELDRGIPAGTVTIP